MAFAPLNKFIFYPARYPEGQWRVQAEVGARDVQLVTADKVSIHAWWFPVEQCDRATLFLHGNAGNVTNRVDHALAINEAGSSVLVVDYRGYGKSKGTPTETGVYRDADAGYDWLTASGFPAQKIVLHGESLGTAVAVELAGRRPCAALVLEAPFTSLAAMADKVVPHLGGVLVRGFATASRIRQVTVPKLIIHGEADDIVPVSQGQAVFDAAQEPKTFWRVPRAGHNDLLDYAGGEYITRLQTLYRGGDEAVSSQ